LLQLRRRRHPSLLLLDDVPRLVCEVPLLAGRDVDVVALGIGMRLQLCRLRRIVMDLAPSSETPDSDSTPAFKRSGSPVRFGAAARCTRRVSRAPISRS